MRVEGPGTEQPCLPYLWNVPGQVGAPRDSGNPRTGPVGVLSALTHQLFAELRTLLSGNKICQHQVRKNRPLKASRMRWSQCDVPKCLLLFEEYFIWNLAQKVHLPRKFTPHWLSLRREEMKVIN